ncbi:MAG: hypothetical protein ACLFTH_04400, partial [Candidatus Woesearchaeota archaeon]
GIHKRSKVILFQIKDVAEVRNIDHISARFIVVDGAEVIFMVMHDDNVHPTYDIGIWVNTPFFASALEQLFELAWGSLDAPMAPKKDSSKTQSGKKK